VSNPIARLRHRRRLRIIPGRKHAKVTHPLPIGFRDKPVEPFLLGLDRPGQRHPARRIIPSVGTRQASRRKYVARSKIRWGVDAYVTLPDGTVRRLKRGRIPTREQAQALEHKLLAEAYEGRFFDRKKEPTATVRQLWTAYEPITKRDNDSWQSDVGRGARLVRLLDEG